MSYTSDIVSPPEPVVRTGDRASPTAGGTEIKNDARGNPLPTKGAAQTHERRGTSAGRRRFLSQAHGCCGVPATDSSMGRRRSLLTQFRSLERNHLQSMRQLLKTTSLFALALVFAAGTAFGQNTLNVTQTGDGNLVESLDDMTATQDASEGGSNVANITQTGAFDDGKVFSHTARIGQVSEEGAPNQISLNQFSASNALGPAGNQEAVLKQEGAGNTIDGTQSSRSSAFANVLQDGNGNSATFNNGKNLNVDQIGNNNTAISRGGGDVTQYQEGNRNTAENVGNSAYQYQKGDDNTAVSTSFVSGTATTQEQYGDWNESYFRNLRGGDSNSATSIQTGNYNEVEANWNQNGGNSLMVEQTSSMSAGMSGGNFADVDFLSEGNTVNITQDGLSNTVISVQK